jgi:DeoR/GlpR family transcriptional regulator of sugar metabolism
MSLNQANIPERRQQRVAELIRESGSVTVTALEKEFGISPATARRDLDALAKQGKVRRTYGGAVMPGLAQHEDSFQQRLGEAVEAKRRLARAASKLLEAEESAFIDSSTTAYYALQRMLADASNVTFLTSLLPVMDLFTTADPSAVSLVGFGGIFRPLTLSFVGPCTIRMIESYRADRTFFSVKGITPEGQLAEANPLEAEVKRAMIRQAANPVLLVDGRKFERQGLSVITHVREVALVLAADPPEDRMSDLTEAGVEVRRV